MMKKHLLTLFASAVTAMFFSGCATPSYNVEVYLSSLFKEQMKIYPSLEVDIVGVNENEAERFESCNVNDYFEIGNALRSSTPHATVYFSETDILPKLLKKSNPVWKKFGKKGAVKLYLLVNLPIEPGKGVAKDIRKMVIPLESSFFGSDDRYFEITPAGINVLKNRPENYPEPAKNNTEEKK